jgi:quinol monooxygenase YgiN
MSDLYVQIAALEIHASQVAAYRLAVEDQANAAIAKEPGVLALNAVANKDDPTRITVFEIYRDRAAYESHLKAEHFLRYKATVEAMVKSLTLTPVSPIVLATKRHV